MKIDGLKAFDIIICLHEFVHLRWLMMKLSNRKTLVIDF